MSLVRNQQTTEEVVDGVRCLHCGARIALIKMLIGGWQWHHQIRGKQPFVACHRWPYPPAEPEPWTLEAAAVGNQQPTKEEQQ